MSVNLGICIVSILGFFGIMVLLALTGIAGLLRDISSEMKRANGVSNDYKRPV